MSLSLPSLADPQHGFTLDEMKTILQQIIDHYGIELATISSRLSWGSPAGWQSPNKDGLLLHGDRLWHTQEAIMCQNANSVYDTIWRLEAMRRSSPFAYTERPKEYDSIQITVSTNFKKIFQRRVTPKKLERIRQVIPDSIDAYKRAIQDAVTESSRQEEAGKEFEQQPRDLGASRASQRRLDLPNIHASQVYRVTQDSRRPTVVNESIADDS